MFAHAYTFMAIKTGDFAGTGELFVNGEKVDTVEPGTRLRFEHVLDVLHRALEVALVLL